MDQPRARRFMVVPHQASCVYQGPSGALRGTEHACGALGARACCPQSQITPRSISRPINQYLLALNTSRVDFSRIPGTKHTRQRCAFFDALCVIRMNAHRNKSDVVQRREIIHAGQPDFKSLPRSRYRVRFIR